MNKFELKKTYKKSEVYENGDYKVRIKVGAYGVTPKAYRCEDDESILSPFDIMIVENKHTGRSAQKRVYQENPISDLEADLKSKIKFKEIWDKID